MLLSYGVSSLLPVNSNDSDPTVHILVIILLKVIKILILYIKQLAYFCWEAKGVSIFRSAL